jgi:hypothetical protein
MSSAGVMFTDTAEITSLFPIQVRKSAPVSAA